MANAEENYMDMTPESIYENGSYIEDSERQHQCQRDLNTDDDQLSDYDYVATTPLAVRKAREESKVLDTCDDNHNIVQQEEARYADSGLTENEDAEDPHYAPDKMVTRHGAVGK